MEQKSNTLFIPGPQNLDERCSYHNHVTEGCGHFTRNAAFDPIKLFLFSAYCVVSWHSCTSNAKIHPIL